MRLHSKPGGIGFPVTDNIEPVWTVVASRGRFYVCSRRTKTWKEVIATFDNEDHAKFFQAALESFEVLDPELPNTPKGF